MYIQAVGNTCLSLYTLIYTFAHTHARCILYFFLLNGEKERERRKKCAALVHDIFFFSMKECLRNNLC